MGTEGELAAAYSKLEGYAARLALLHHVVTHIDLETSDIRPVGPRSVEAGITLVRWFAGEAERIYTTLSETVEERDTRRLIDWIRAHGGQTTARALQKSNSRKYPTTDTAKAALDALAEAEIGEWVEPNRTKNGGQPARRFILHPTPDTTDSTSPDDGDEPDDDDPPMPDTSPDSSPPIFSFAERNEGSVGTVGCRTGQSEIDGESKTRQGRTTMSDEEM